MFISERSFPEASRSVHEVFTKCSQKSRFMTALFCFLARPAWRQRQGYTAQRQNGARCGETTPRSCLSSLAGYSFSWCWLLSLVVCQARALTAAAAWQAVWSELSEVGGIGSTIAGWSMIFMTFAYGCTGLIVSWSVLLVLCVSVSPCCLCCDSVAPFLPASSPRLCCYARVRVRVRGWAVD